MQLTGLDLGTLCVVLLASVLLLLLLHTQREPARRVVVASLSAFLGALPKSARPSTRRLRILRRASLALAVAVALLLALALGAPVLVGSAGPRTLLILVDHSRSMAAHDVAPSRLEVAKQRALALIETLGAHDRALVATLDRRATPRTSFTHDRSQLARAIAEITVSHSEADLAEGARLARALLPREPGAAIVLLSDGNVAHVDEGGAMLHASALPLQHAAIGQSGRNVAVTALAERRDPLDPLHRRVFVSLHNFGREREPLTLSLHLDGVLIAQEAITVAPGERALRTLHGVPVRGDSLEARATLARGPDLLPDDDRRVVPLSSLAARRILCVARDDRYLEAALLLDETREVVTIDPTAYRSADGFDAVIFARTLPPSPPEVPALYLGPSAEAGAFPLVRRGTLARPFVDVVQASEPLVHGLALRDVNIARAIEVALTPEDRALAATSHEAPLIVAGARAGVPFVALTFDVLASDLPLRAAFPLLVVRALDHLAPTAPRRDPLAQDASADAGSLAPRALGARARPGSLDGEEERRANPLLRPLLIAALALIVLEWIAHHRRWSA